ncbi:MAG: DUF4174 domain-containing protein [Pseudomonadota bacterium]
MPSLLTHLAAAALAQASMPIAAAGLDAGLTEFRWQSRPIIVFADGAEDPRLIEQLDHFEGAAAALTDRDTIVLLDTTPAEMTPLRRRFAPDGFTVILVGKDGGEKLRRDRVVNIEEISALIDTMPMRRNEMRRANGDTGTAHGGAGTE